MASNLREFLMLCQTFDGKQNLAGWWASPKLDGCRAFWDGSITRGMQTLEIPWANIERDGRYVITPKATGLWSRYGKSIQAPDWWLDKLPNYCLDGELWMGRGRFQDVMSTVKQLEPDSRWEDIQFCVFDAPSYREWLADGEIRLKKKYEKRLTGCVDWAIKRATIEDPRFLRGSKSFENAHEYLLKHLKVSEHLRIVEQTQLPYNVPMAKEMALKMATDEVDAGGEGVIVRLGRSLWVPRRVANMLKIKPYLDDEGTVVGYVWGEETELGSKLLGLMGSLIISWKDKTFRLSGFTEAERRMMSLDGFELEGFEHPGKIVSANHYNPLFPIGSTVTFRYRELTDDGKPKEGRFWRKTE